MGHSLSPPNLGQCGGTCRKNKDPQEFRTSIPRSRKRIAIMTKLCLVFLVCCCLCTTVDAADKIRIGYPDFNSSTFTLPLAQLRGFFHEEGLQAELIRIRSAVAIPALTSGE